MTAVGLRPLVAVCPGAPPEPVPAPPADHRYAGAWRLPPPVPQPTTSSARYLPARNPLTAYRYWRAPAQPEPQRVAGELGRLLSRPRSEATDACCFWRESHSWTAGCRRGGGGGVLAPLWPP